jgi:hypothetical protein
VSRHIKCDRCGKEMPGTPALGEKISDMKIITREGFPEPKFRSGIEVRDSTCDYDFCESCISSFEEWRTKVVPIP